MSAHTTLLALAIVAVGASAVEALPPIRVSAGATDTHIRKLASRELVAYLGKLFTNPVRRVTGSAACEIVIGTPESNQRVAAAVELDKIALPEGRNQDQGYSIKTVGRTIYVAGRTDVGVLYGVYTLLEEYGAYFQIDGEVLPARAAFAVKKLDVSASPVFRYRGLLPWDNFLCGMSGYNLEDYKKLIDCATRMKLNMLQFHFYNGMAFFTETVGGETVDPSCIGMPIDVFKTAGAVGEQAFAGQSVYGPKPYVDNIGKPRAQAQAVQRMMREVVDHARSQGWATCLGFELMHSALGNPTRTDKPSDNGFGSNLINPLDPHNADISVERYRSLVRTYPQSDYYWMWQSEAQGILASNVGREPGAAEMRAKYGHWAQKSPIWGNNLLGGDIDYAYLFREVANRLTPEERSRLATGGWSVEHLFPNIDTDFPRELIFASLNCFDVAQATGHQYKSYQVAESGRRAWMIDWWEFDGEQWFPQFRANWQEKLYASCAEYGVEAVTLLGWKLSGIEHNVRYLAEFAWNPKLTAKQFYDDYASRVYGSGARSIASIYGAYDKLAASQPSYGPAGFAPPNMYLSPGWCSMPVPVLPRSKRSLDEPQWKSAVIDSSPDYVRRLEEMRAMDKRSIETVASLVPGMPESGRSQARLMINRLEVRRLYAKSLSTLYSALMEYDRIARSQGVEAAAEPVKPKVLESVSYARMMIEKYAEETRNRNDQGVVAQLNEQYYQVLKRFANEIDRVAFATIDWTAFRIKPWKRFDFASESWVRRDGKVEIAKDTIDGRPTLRLTIGGDGTQFNSAHIHSGSIDLDRASFMDFRVRTTSREPLAILFQLESGSQVFYSLNLVGEQGLFSHADSVPEDSINDGKWHRVTFDLKRVVREGLGSDQREITNVVIGSWMTPREPIVVEFQDFALGERNLLD